MFDPTGQIPLSASDSDGNTLTLRVVSQPDNGTVGLVNRTATYYPEPGFVGSDEFTFAAWDGATDSNLASIAIQVTPDRIFANGFRDVQSAPLVSSARVDADGLLAAGPRN